MLNGSIGKVLNIVAQIRKQQKEDAEQEKETTENYFNFRFFKVKKTSLVIAVLNKFTLAYCKYPFSPTWR